MTSTNETTSELAHWKVFAQNLTNENEALKARLLAFEEGRDASDFPIDSNGWHYDGERFVLAPHPRPAYPGEEIVICDLNGPQEARERNAALICQARSAIFWCEAHQRASEDFRKQVAEREEKIARLRAEIAELNRITALLPPDLLPVLEQLFERFSFHFSADSKTIGLVQEASRICEAIKKVQKQ